MIECAFLIVSIALVIMTLIICVTVIFISHEKMKSLTRQHEKQLNEAENIKKELRCKRHHQKDV